MRKPIPALLLLTGLALLLYPVLSCRQSHGRQAEALAGYRQTVSRLGEDACQQLLDAAQTQRDPALLVVDESGIIGSVSIPKLRTELPIYPGTGETQLQMGAGLLEGCSLPLGGAGCHSVLSAHNGLPEARLFTGLEQLVPGDTFTVTVLNRSLTYRIDQIQTVLPRETDALLPREGLDLCTLLTCTPYGINSHRLLVRGCRSDSVGQAMPSHSLS